MRYGVQAILPQFAAGNLRWLPTRYGSPLVAVVIHRMLGTLNGTDQWFRYYSASGVASVHWGVGFMSLADKAAGRAQIRQWVDSAYTAFGWNARPSDTPTDLARRVLGPVGLYDSSVDMNRLVIAIEVEGQRYEDPWHPAVTRRVRELLDAIADYHGPLWVMAHQDLSTKLCPGMATFNAALPGLYGSRLGGPTSIPDTSTGTPPAPPTNTLRGELPMSLFVPNPPRLVTVPEGTKLRAAPSFNAGIVRTTSGRRTFPLIGYTRGATYNAKVGTSRRWSLVRIDKAGTDDPFEGHTVYFPRILGDERTA